MGPPASGRRFLGIGPEAPRPSGDEDAILRDAMLAQMKVPPFRLRVNVWSRLTLRGKFDWNEYERRLRDESEFRAYASWSEARQSLGWAGRTADGKKWLFAVAGYRILLYGKSAMRHELFHAAQDLMTGLYGRDPWLPRIFLAELSAHLWGGPGAAAFAFSFCIALGFLAYWVVAVALNFFL